MRDARGRLTSITNALNQVTSYEYDLAGRLKKIIYPDTNFVLFTYDLAGRRTKIKDPRGNETTFAFDAAYRVSSETNAANNVTSYSYDLMSNLTGVTDALSHTTNYTYDDFNRLTKIRYPEATPGAGRLEENFTYDLAGNLLTKTDQAGRVTTPDSLRSFFNCKKIFDEKCKNCGPPGSPVPVPKPADARRSIGPGLEELRMQEESARQMEIFWKKVLFGSIAGGAVLVGGPPAVAALLRALATGGAAAAPAYAH